MDALSAFARRYGAGDPMLEMTGRGPHGHHGSEISGPFNEIAVIGDVFSTNWDGANPADLSGGADSAATAGFYLDASAGVGQFQTLYAEGGSFTGTITAAAGTIGGFTIGASTITGGDLILNSSGKVTVYRHLPSAKSLLLLLHG